MFTKSCPNLERLSFRRDFSDGAQAALDLSIAELERMLILYTNPYLWSKFMAHHLRDPLTWDSRLFGQRNLQLSDASRDRNHRCR